MAMVSELEELQALLESWGVEHFGAAELVRLKNPRWDGPTHVVPALDLRHHMRRTVTLADRLREVYGKPLRVVSGYRPRAYNDLVGGSAKSQHLRFRALDLQPVDADDLAKVAELAEAMLEVGDLAGWPTGFGIYDSFIHVDIGAEGTGKRRWDGRR